MKKIAQKKLEQMILELPKRFPDIREIWFNSEHIDIDETIKKQPTYLIINDRMNFKLEDEFTKIILRAFRQYKEDICLLQLLYNPDFKRKIYQRD